jgi:hypothetical protein
MIDHQVSFDTAAKHLLNRIISHAMGGGPALSNYLTLPDLQEMSASIRKPDPTDRRGARYKVNKLDEMLETPMQDLVDEYNEIDRLYLMFINTVKNVIQSAIDILDTDVHTDSQGKKVGAALGLGVDPEILKSAVVTAGETYREIRSLFNLDDTGEVLNQDRSEAAPDVHSTKNGWASGVMIHRWLRGYSESWETVVGEGGRLAGWAENRDIAVTQLSDLLGGPLGGGHKRKYKRRKTTKRRKTSKRRKSINRMKSTKRKSMKKRKNTRRRRTR